MKPAKPHNGGTWTEARKTSFIMSALRGASRRWGPAYAAKKSAKLAFNTYRCAACKKTFGSKQIKIDHIAPVRSVVPSENTWDQIIARMFPEIDGYQALCIPCHSTKTEQENAARRANKKNQCS